MVDKTGVLVRHYEGIGLIAHAAATKCCRNSVAIVNRVGLIAACTDHFVIDCEGCRHRLVALLCAERYHWLISINLTAHAGFVGLGCSRTICR